MHGSTRSLSELQRLEIDISRLLADADRLGLPLVGIHLCNALEVLREEAPQMFAADGTDSGH